MQAHLSRQSEEIFQLLRRNRGGVAPGQQLQESQDVSQLLALRWQKKVGIKNCKACLAPLEARNEETSFLFAPFATQPYLPGFQAGMQPS